MFTGHNLKNSIVTIEVEMTLHRKYDSKIIYLALSNIQTVLWFFLSGNRVLGLKIKNVKKVSLIGCCGYSHMKSYTFYKINL